MVNTFEMKLNDYTFVLPKNSVKFKYGYGIVNAILNVSDEGGEDYKLVGVVDKHFNTIIPLSPVDEITKISILPNNNIVFMVEMNNDPNDIMNNEIYHIKVQENEEDNEYACIKACDYVQIDDNLIKICKFGEEEYSERLFSVNDNKFMGPEFSSISNFNHNKVQSAVATIILGYEDEGTNELTCNINKKGQVISKIVDKDFGVTYDKSVSLEECIKDTLKRMHKATLNRNTILDKGR